MPIRIYNSFTNRKENFKPLRPKEVKIYVCGVTVYDECHIGHIRSLFVFDFIRRYFQFRGYKVKFVRNITDIDDKIIERAKELRQDVGTLAKEYIQRYYQDLESLRLDRADIEPKATQHIAEILKMVKGLIKKGFAYVVRGDVYFSVRSFSKYGRLSKQRIDEILQGVRIEKDEKKKDPLDFALWKKSSPQEPGWMSPWGRGRGRPGWHIECSAMSMKYLGETFDIHAGGRDLIFPHHENEIAQSESYTGKKFVNFWMHNGLLTVNGEKMSKSKGNFISVADLLKRFSPEDLKFFFLLSHYSSEIDFNFEKMEQAKRLKERFYLLLEKMDRFLEGSPPTSFVKAKEKRKIDGFRKKFIQAMDDDFNSPKALASLFDLYSFMNRFMQATKKPKLKHFGTILFAKSTLLNLGRVLGLFEEKREIPSELAHRLIQLAVEIRSMARSKGDFQFADKIRQRLKELGITLEDGRQETIWRVNL